jgi:DNA-binding transcriptional LysR family regulator
MEERGEPMNFRTCKYFLTVCEMGTISAAARKLFISQQSLSQHIKKLEEEVGIQLFHRDDPLTLTQAGECVRRSAETILAALEQMDSELAVCRGSKVPELNIGLLDYGSPDFMASLLDLYLRKQPNILVNTREIEPGGQLPADIPLFISPRELGPQFKNEPMLYDRLVVCVKDSLLKKVYGDDWRDHQRRLLEGDFSALEGCPFLRHSNTPLQAMSQYAFDANSFSPVYVSVAGRASTLMQLCIEGRGAVISMLGVAQHTPNIPPIYMIPNIQPRIPSVFLCWRADTVLSNSAQQFLEVTRAYFKKINSAAAGTAAPS